MKRSQLLAKVIKDVEKPPFDKPTSKALLAMLEAGLHEPVYAWLMANHAEVERLRNRWDRVHMGWEAIAQIIT